MIPSSFTQGVWGKSWEEARGDNAVQGTANLGDEGVVLDIPCGKLLGSPGVVINGEKEPSAAEHLYGFSQDGYALVLGNAAYSSGETHYPGMVHQVIRADHLMAAKGCREFDPSNVIKRVDIEVRNLADWYGKTAFCMAFESGDQDDVRFRALEYKKEDDEATVLLESEQCSITLFSKYIIPGLNVNEMTFRHQCCLKVCFSAGKTLEETRDFAVKLSKLLSLCMGFHAAIQNPPRRHKIIAHFVQHGRYAFFIRCNTKNRYCRDCHASPPCFPISPTASHTASISPFAITRNCRSSSLPSSVRAICSQSFPAASLIFSRRKMSPDCP